MSIDLKSSEQKTIVVTGASRGLGAAVCLRFMDLNYRVIGISRSGEVPHGVESVVLDVTDPAQVTEKLKPFSRDRSLEGLVNCAGVAAMNLVAATPPSKIEDLVRINLLGTILMSQALAKPLCRNKSGRVVNVSTIAVRLGLKGEAVYAATKAGVETFSRSFAREMADFGVTVNCVAPGPIRTDLIAGVPHGAIEKVVNQQAFRRYFTPEEFAELVELLFSPKARNITGEVIALGGS